MYFLGLKTNYEGRNLLQEKKTMVWKYYSFFDVVLHKEDISKWIIFLSLSFELKIVDSLYLKFYCSRVKTLQKRQ